MAINEANGTPSHRDMKQIIAQARRQRGAIVETESRLTNGKIADVLSLDPFGNLTIIEVKTQFRPYLLSTAYSKYAGFCHYLWIAVPDLDPGLRQIERGLYSWSNAEDRVGLLGISWAGPRVSRPSQLLDTPPLHLALTRDRLKNRLTAGEPAQSS